MATASASRSRADSALLSESIGWDVSNWGRALQFCVAHSALRPEGSALEVGADGENGGLSLYLAQQGWDVTCSGLDAPTAKKLELHRRHDAGSRIRYARLDVLNPPPGGTYDLIALKSVLGHVGQGERFDLMRRAVRNLHDMLRPGGELWVLENAAATPVHEMVRRRLGAGRFGWRYLRPDELDVLLAPFASRRRKAFGVAAAAGRTEAQRAVLGRLDRSLLEPLTPDGWRYVLAAVATRQGAA